MEGLEPQHFLIKANQIIYNAMIYLYATGNTPTPLAINQMVTGEVKEELDKMGGINYLEALVEAESDEENLKLYINKQKTLYARKEFYYINKENIKSLLDEETDLTLEEILSMSSKYLDIINKLNSQQQVYKMGDKLEERLAERIKNPGKIAGIPTGFEMFDTLTGGGRKGDLIFICARAKTGKSTALQNIATNQSIIGIEGIIYPILYIDTEMNEEEQEDRILANLTGIPVRELESGLFALDTENGTGEEKKAKVRRANALLHSGHFYHVYMPDFTIQKIEALTRQYQLEKGVQVLYFDYLKIPEASSSSLRTAQEYQMLGFMASGLKDIAGKLGIPVFSACQENRTGEDDDDKSASNIGGSDRILHLATKLVFLYNKSNKTIEDDGIEKGNQELRIKYQRNGESDCTPINIMFYKNKLRMEEVV